MTGTFQSDTGGTSIPLLSCRPCVTSTPSSSARQTFPSGLSPAMKDCFGLHGHYAFGSVAKEKSGVGRKSATSVGLTTDLVHWLQAGKTVAVVRFASKIHRLASAFRTASVASLPAAIPSRPPCGGPTTGWRRSSCCRCGSSYSSW